MRPPFFPFRALSAALSVALPLALALAPSADAGERVKAWVSLRDKGPAAAGLSGRAYEDAPVHPPYLDSLRAAGLEVSTVLKWQNKVSGWADASRLPALRGLSFVASVAELPRKVPAAAPAAPGLPRRAASSAATAEDFGNFHAVFEAVGATRLRDTVAARGLKPGEGVRIAVMDDGFRLGHQAFDSLFARGGIVDQWDFVADTSVAVSRTLGESHGASTLSQIAGDLPTVLQGLAPHARFLLYRTEDAANEAYVEEDYLAAALERAVDSGAQVISISLGYRYDFDSGSHYPYSQMDGRTRPSSIAALGAARRGALVVVAIGNEYASRFGEPTLTAPSDADSILAVGSVNASGERCSYSSTGPSYDGRLKPEITSIGCAVPVANPSTAAGVYSQSGTSFAAPVVSGVAALLLQLHSGNAGVTPQHVRKALMNSGTRASSPDGLVGKGLLRASVAHELLLPRSLAGTLPWRGRPATLPWANVAPAKSRLWDARGREQGVRGSWSPEGDILIESSDGKMAQGAYFLKIPRAE